MNTDPSKKLMGMEVGITKYEGDPMNSHGIVRGYDPASKKWWVTNLNMPYQGTVSDWFAEDELKIDYGVLFALFEAEFKELLNKYGAEFTQDYDGAFVRFESDGQKENFYPAP